VNRRRIIPPCEMVTCLSGLIDITADASGAFAQYFSTLSYYGRCPSFPTPVYACV